MDNDIFEMDLDEDDLVQLSFLRDEETDALIAAGLLSRDLSLESPLDSPVAFPHPELVLHVTPSSKYPIEPVVFYVNNISLPREAVDELRRKLRDIISAADATNNISQWQKREETEHGIFEPIQVILQMARATLDYLHGYHQKCLESKMNLLTVPGATIDKSLFFIPENDQKHAVQPSSYSHTTASVNELAYQILPFSRQQLLDQVPPPWRVLHVEQVLRQDQANNLLAFQASLRKKLARVGPGTLRKCIPWDGPRNRMEDMIDYLVTPKLTFHGTEARHVPSIIRHGFVLPDKFNPSSGEDLDVRCGSTFGRGIYSSPSASYALSYSQGLNAQVNEAKRFFGCKLFICATIMGRAKYVITDERLRLREQGEVDENADSHVAMDGNEYVVFSSEQIVPVYVFHIDMPDFNQDIYQAFKDEADDQKFWKRMRKEMRHRDTDEGGYAGDLQRHKKELLSRAAKHFPYGYGPATGGKFVIEAVADVSDNEEEYGEYQFLRAEDDEERRKGEDLDRNVWTWVKRDQEERADEFRLAEGGHYADEYGYHRDAQRVPIGFTKGADGWDALGEGGENTASDAVAEWMHDDEGDFGFAAMYMEDENDIGEQSKVS